MVYIIMVMCHKKLLIHCTFKPHIFLSLFCYKVKCVLIHPIAFIFVGMGNIVVKAIVKHPK